jgi:hypothetical protein
MDRRTARSSNTDLNSERSSLQLSPLQLPVKSNCNIVQFLAMAIREASVMAVYEIFNLFNPVRFSEIEMILASVIFGQSYRNNDCSPVQWVDIDKILACVI